MNVRNIQRVLESVAPLAYAESWDNVGLLIGDPASRVRKLMLCIDLTEAVLAEALAAKATMVMAYHPILFKDLKKLTADAAPVVYRAARKGIAVYSMHTALDVAPGGTNDVLADVLGLADVRPLEATMQQGRCQIVTFVPADDLDAVATAAFDAGAGVIGNYHDCSFVVHGLGTFCGNDETHPTVGQAGRHEAVEEMRVEMVAPVALASEICQAIRTAHSYEKPVVDVYPLLEYPAGFGMGRVGRLGKPIRQDTLVTKIKKALSLTGVQVAQAGQKDRRIGTVAVGAGSCGSLWKKALAAGAGLYLTGEMRHHDALAAQAAGLTVVCTGHSNSERITLTHLAQRLEQACPTLEIQLARADRDPFRIA